MRDMNYKTGTLKQEIATYVTVFYMLLATYSIYSVCKWKSGSDTHVTTSFIFYDPHLSNTELSTFGTIFVTRVQVSQILLIFLGTALLFYVAI